MQRFLRELENPAALLALVVAILLSVGMVMVYSASGARAGLEEIRVSAKREARAEEAYVFHHRSDYFLKQAMWAAFGLIAGAVLLKLPLEYVEKYALAIFLACLFLLILVSFSPLGVSSKGARRWLRAGPFTVQPAEFAKIGLVVFLAKFLSDKREQIRDLAKGFLPCVGIVGFFCVLVMLEKDLGTIMLMGTVVVGMWCLAQVRFRHLGTLVMLALPGVVFLVFQHSYRLNRILAFLDPEKYAMTYGYQLDQSLVTVGSGGTFGAGLGMGLQKYHFLSESHTDFIFAIVCEELGLVGAASIGLLFLSLIFLGLRISYKAPDYFSSLAAAGLTMVIGFAAFINFFVVLGLAPTKGLALPFFTYGGSSLMASLAAVALLINISNYSVGRTAQGAPA